MPDVCSTTGIVWTNSCRVSSIALQLSQRISTFIYNRLLSQSSTFPLLRRRLSVMPNSTNSAQFFFQICIGLKCSFSDTLEGRIEPIKAPFLQSVMCMQITYLTKVPIASTNFIARCFVKSIPLTRGKVFKHETQSFSQPLEMNIQ